MPLSIFQIRDCENAQGRCPVAIPYILAHDSKKGIIAQFYQKEGELETLETWEVATYLS